MSNLRETQSNKCEYFKRALASSKHFTFTSPKSTTIKSLLLAIIIDLLWSIPTYAQSIPYGISYDFRKIDFSRKDSNQKSYVKPHKLKVGTVPERQKFSSKIDQSPRPYIYEINTFYPGVINYARNEEEHYFLKTAILFKLQADSLNEAYQKAKLEEVTNKIASNPELSSKGLEEAFQAKYKALSELIERKRKDAITYFYFYDMATAAQLFPTLRYDGETRSKLFFENTANKETKYLSNYLVTYGLKNNKVSAYTEAYHDYFGSLRISIGTLISNNTTVGRDSSGITIIDSSETKDDAIQRIIGGGGNIVINANLPILFSRSRQNKVRALVNFNPKISCDLPAIGTYSSDFIFKTDIGTEAAVFLNGSEGNLSFYSITRSSYIFGNSTFYDYLSTPSQKVNNGYFMHQTSIGVAVKEMFRFGVILYYGDPFVVKNFPTTVFVSIVP